MFNDERDNLKDVYKRLLGNNFSNYECMLELLRLGQQRSLFSGKKRRQSP